MRFLHGVLKVILPACHTFLANASQAIQVGAHCVLIVFRRHCVPIVFRRHLVIKFPCGWLPSPVIWRRAGDEAELFLIDSRGQFRFRTPLVFTRRGLGLLLVASSPSINSLLPPCAVHQNPNWVKIAIYGGYLMTLQVGYLAPDFTLPSHLDKPISLSDYRGKNVVIAFFPLAWTKV
jgi:hypothetical protein